MSAFPLSAWIIGGSLAACCLMLWLAAESWKRAARAWRETSDLWRDMAMRYRAEVEQQERALCAYRRLMAEQINEQIKRGVCDG